MVGGGHAHLSVLRALANRRPLGVEVALVTPTRYLHYPDMLSGWVAGHYPLSACRVDLQPLAEAAGVRLVLTQMAGMDADRRCVALKDGQQIEYDLLSLDVGSETNTSWLEVLGTKLLPIKPLDSFFIHWPHILAAAKARPGYQLVVVGGGTVGVEMALAALFAFDQAGVAGRVELVASESGLLPGHAPGIRARVQRLVRRTGLGLHFSHGVGTEAGVLLSDGMLLPADKVIAATGARAPIWLGMAKLAVDSDGYLLVDKYHRSVTHPNVFAVGGVCARHDVLLSRSGVRSAHSGATLAHNLLATLRGGVLQSYTPKPRAPYLLACGPQYAVVSWGRWSAEGRWVWRWKDWIDRRFIRRFATSGQLSTAQMQEHTP